MMMGPGDIEEMLLLEEQDKRRARESFLAFYLRMTGFQPPRHIRIMAKLYEAMEADLIDRAMLFAPPRHAKTLTGTTLFPAWLMGRYPSTKIMSVVHTQKYAGKVGRNVRNLLLRPEWPFPAVTLADDSQAREQWATNQGGEYNGFGAIGGNQHGNPAEWLLMDDLVKGRKIAMSAHMREEVWETYKTDLLSRLQGRAKQLMTFCLTGETPITMADNTTKPLAEVRPGDRVLSRADDGSVRANRVLAFVPQGEDDILEMRAGGSIVRGNARHPFLRMKGLTPEWVQLGDLRPGDLIAQSAVLPESCEAACDMDPEEAFALGYMLADGWLTLNHKQNKRADGTKYPAISYVSCVAATSGNPLKDAARARVLSFYAGRFSLKWRETRFGYARVEKAVFGRYLQAFGLGAGAKHKRIPAFLFSAPLPVRRALLQGFMVADGSRRAIGNCHFTACALSNEALTADMRHLARSCGHRVTNISRKSYTTHPPNSPKPVLSKQATFRFHHRDDFGAPIRWVAVRSIEIAGRAPVFDLTVDRDANFFADGLASHNTRWHMDDPAGRILPEDYDGRTGWYKDRETGEDWYVLSLPAVAEHEDDPLGRKPGEWLWPEAFGEKKLGGMRKRGGWMWSALFQQRPSPQEGLMFTDEHLRRFNLRQIDLTALQIYISSDYAVTEEGQGENPDWTVHMVWGVDSDLNIYLLDMWRGRTESDQWVLRWVGLVLKWKPLRAFEEAGQILKSVGPMIKASMQKYRAFVDRVQITSSTDKPSRAQALLGWGAMGKLYLPTNESVPAEMLPHLEAFLTELKQFPTGRKDDTVDAATLFARALDRIIAGQPPEKERSPHGDTLDDLFERHEAEQERRNRRR